MENNKQLIYGLVLGLIFVLLNVLGVFKRTRRYFRKRELARISKSAPTYDIKRAVSIIRANLPQDINISDKTIEDVIELRDSYINSDESYKIRPGPTQDVQAITKHLNDQGIAIDSKTTAAVFDAELIYLKELRAAKG